MTRSRNKKLTGVSSSSKDPVNDDEIVQMRGRDSKRAPACSRQPTPCGSGGQAHSTFENSGNSSRNLQKPTNRYGDASLPLNRNARMECKKAESDVYACNSASVAGSSRLLSFKYANPSSEKELKARLVWLREHIAQEQDLVEMHRLNQEIVTVLSQLEAAMSQDEHKNTKVFGTKRKFTPEPEISEVLTGGGLLMKAKAPQQSKTTLAGHSASEHAQTTAVAASAHHQAKTAQSRPKTSHSVKKSSNRGLMQHRNVAPSRQAVGPNWRRNRKSKERLKRLRSRKWKASSSRQATADQVIGKESATQGRNIQLPQTSWQSAPYPSNQRSLLPDSSQQSLLSSSDQMTKRDQTHQALQNPRQPSTNKHSRKTLNAPSHSLGQGESVVEDAAAASLKLTSRNHSPSQAIKTEFDASHDKHHPASRSRRTPETKSTANVATATLTEYQNAIVISSDSDSDFESDSESDCHALPLSGASSKEDTKLVGACQSHSSASTTSGDYRASRRRTPAMVVAAPRQRQEKFSDHVSPISPKAAEGTWKADHQPLPGGSIYDVPLSDDGREASSLQSKSRSGALFEMSDSYILQAKQEALQLSNGYSPGKEAVMEDGGSTSHRRVLRETVLRRQKSQGKPCHVPIESDDNEFGYGRQRAVTIPPERAAKSEFCRPMPVTQDPSTIASKPLIRRTIEVRVPRVKPSNIIDLETSSSDCDSEANGLSRSNLSSPSEDARSRYAPSPKLGSVHYNTFEEGLASHPGRQTKPAQNGTEDEMLATASPYESFIPDKLWRHRSVARGRGVTTDAGAPVHTAEDHSPRSGNKNIGSTLKHKTPQQAQVEHRATTVQPSPTATRRSLRTIARYPEFIRLLSESLIPEPSSRRGRQWNDKCLASPSAAQASRDSGSSQAGNRPLTRSSRSKTAPRLESERRSMNPRASRDQQAESDFEESYFASRASYRGERGRFTRDASILSVPSPSRILRSSGSRLDGN